MKINRELQANSFQKGMMLDASDMIMPSDTARFAQNMRLINRSGSSYVSTNLQGTEVGFALTTGFEPVAAQEFAGVLYIISWNSTTEELELGSYPSPNYSNVDPNNNTLVYRPLNNYDGGAFRTDKLDTSSKPVIQKLDIQPDYDESVNMCFTVVGGRPRIVNTKFKAENNGTSFSILADRTTESASAASNTYTEDSVNKETSLILFSQKVLGIQFNGIVAGGKLKCGNYQYVFYYMTEDFNRTSIIGQTSTCQVSFGEGVSSMRGGDETQETNKKASFTLSNVDTDFRYIKVYIMYSSGQDSVIQQYLEVVTPLEITGSSMQFFHTGFETLTEVSQDEVNVDYASIDSASASTQVGGYYFLGDIKQRTIFFNTLREVSGAVQPLFNEKALSIGSVGFPGYTDPSNVYNYLGYMGRETYPFGIVYIMNDGSLSPTFPIKSVDFQNGSTGTTSPLPATQQKGLITFPFINQKPYYDSVNNAILVKHLRFNLTTVAANAFVKENTIGFFIVRGERRANMVTQGVLIPTIKAPTIEASDADPGNQNGFGANTNVNNGSGGYYRTNASDQDDINSFKHLINLDSIVEAFLHNWESGENTVLDGDGGISSGYMPLSIPVNTGNYNNSSSPAPKIWVSKSTDSKARHWAFLSGEALANEPEYVTALQRESMGLHQIGKISFRVEASGEVTPVYIQGGYSSYRFGSHYNMIGNHTLYGGVDLKTIKKTVYVPAESLATGTDFISKIKVALVTILRNSGSFNSDHYWVNQWYNSYFGIEMLNQDLVDSEPGVNNPIGGNSRPGKQPLGAQGYDAIPSYSNLNKDIPAAFLVNIYPQNTILSADQLYETVDGIVYKQISPRYSWNDANGNPNNFSAIDIFGGDCYISKVSRKLNHAPVRDASAIQTEKGKRWNIDSGMILSWWQESKYNLHLRQPKQYDISELEKRSFFPYQSLGDPIRYRKYRLPETTAHSPGYSVVNAPKSFFGVSPLTPFERTRFMNRIYHSEKHIPNAFRNGYRSFLETSFRDYDSGMGSIKALFNHRGMLLIIFEHGIGITAIEQRVETGGDAAGAVFIEPTSVLPPTITYLSREIGCQDTLGLVQTPGAVYGIDRAKDKIWRISDGLKVLSDESVSSWLIDNPAVNPRSGYDFENNEVIFTTDNWCLCFTEGLDKFTSFYTFTNASFFARRNKEMYSFITNTAHKHNSASTYLIYGSAKDVIVEMVVNKNIGSAKVVDYLNIISNEVTPSKIEVYSYNQDVLVGPIIESGQLNQYSSIEYEINALTEEPNMLYRDKKFVVQIPYRQDYNTGSDVDKWGLEGRVRDKAVIVRITYQTDKPLELASVLNYFRYSHS